MERMGRMWVAKSEKFSSKVIVAKEVRGPLQEHEE